MSRRNAAQTRREVPDAMENQVINRIGQVLLAHKEAKKSWPKVVEAIAEANGNPKKPIIDRRTVERLSKKKEWKNVQLKIPQLIALDTYLIANGEESFLTKERTLIDSIAESFDVNFLIPARRYPGVVEYVVPWWDFRATTRLMRTRLNQLRVRIWHIINDEHWKNGDARIANSPNIAVGSPVANPASEMLLCRMLGIEPYKKCDLDELPFFIVRADRDGNASSAFVRTRKETKHFDAKKRKKLAPELRAFVLDGKMYKSTEQEDYALLVGQRDPETGHVQMVLCGLTGQATYRLARVLQSGHPRDTVPDLQSEQERPPIFVALYKFELGGDDPRGGKIVTSATPVVRPALIHYIDGEWQFDDELIAAD